MTPKINIAVVGLGFGSDFAPIYQQHPNVEQVILCDPNEERLNLVGDRFGIPARMNRYEQVLESDWIDAVHLVTGIPLHAPQALAALKSGKHCASTVPMSMNLDDLHALVQAQQSSGKNYMMMETGIYTRQFLQVKKLLESGEIGRIQFLQGAHYQDMEGWPSYWIGLPPMYYATHVIGPLLALADTRAVKVHCLGSGKMRDELVKPYNNPYPIETAMFQLENSDAVMEVTRSLYETARSYQEGFNILGDRLGFEWGRDEKEAPVLYRMEAMTQWRGRPVNTEAFEAPDCPDLLPASINRFTKEHLFTPANSEPAITIGGGHHGSHPHLVHEFISSIIENRKPRIDAVTAANWTAAGICAHQSAMRDGEGVEIPSFEV